MSSTKDSGSGSLAGKVLVLEGTSNYHAWLESIQSFLMTLKVWRIADGTSKYPTTGNDEVKNTWFDSDYQALGVISLHIKEDLRTSVAKTYNTAFDSLSHTTLANLAKLYATSGPPGQFHLFREIVNWRLGGGRCFGRSRSSYRPICPPQGCRSRPPKQPSRHVNLHWTWRCLLQPCHNRHSYNWYG